jgi:hypothetical protein
MKNFNIYQKSVVALAVAGLVAASSSALTALAATKTVDLGQTQTVTWQAANYDTSGVSVNVIRKVSDNPARYELVRTVASDMSNSGSATWVPAWKDIGENDFIQVGCKPSPKACRAGLSQGQLAVVNSDLFSNTAATYQAIEQLNNK